MIKELSPAQLKQKIFKYIEREGPVSMEQVWERGVTHGIDTPKLEAVITSLHRDKKSVTCTSKGNTIYYSIPKQKSTGPLSHIQWINDNYMRPEPCKPGCTGYCEDCMPFPEIDMSYLFLRGEEREIYKAAAKGRPYVPGRKRTWERRSSSTPKPERVLTENEKQLVMEFAV